MSNGYFSTEIKFVGVDVTPTIRDCSKGQSITAVVMNKFTVFFSLKT